MSGQVSHIPETRVKVLMLNFEYTDLDDLEEEALQVYMAFRSKGYEVEEYSIKMQDPENRTLLERLTLFLSGEGALRILYYHGHGAFSFQTGLQFCSHNYPDDVDTLQHHARVLWRSLRDTLEKRKEIMLECKQYQEQRYVSWRDEIAPLIKSAKHKVLVILDCCYSGGSVASDDKKIHNTIQSTTSYTKELLSASSWGSETSNRMSPALCDVLRSWKGDLLSVQELQENMSKFLGKEGQKKEGRLNKAQESFELEIKKLEEERIKYEAKKKELLLTQRKLFDKMEGKKAERRQAEEEVKKYRFYESTAKKHADTRDAREVAKMSLKKVEGEIHEFNEDKKKHDTDRAEFRQKQKDLEDELSVLEAKEAKVKEELSLLAQPVHTRLSVSAGSSREPIVLPNLHQLEVDSN